VLRWFTRERNAVADTHTNDDPIGRPNILKLANRFESYVDIENKVMRLPNAGRSSSISMTTPQVDTKATASDSGYESNEESETETNAASDSVAGIMV
jgi:hypothetical protein